MTVVRDIPAAKLLRCDGCGKMARSDEAKGWMRYSSLLHEEICPNELPDACSEKCLGLVGAKLDLGSMKLPKLSKRGPNMRVVQKRVGY